MNGTTHSNPTGFSRTDWICAALVVVLAFLWSSAALWWKPAPGPHTEFIFGDEGQNLFIADRILAGQRIYRDFFCQYGPLPLYIFTGVARCFGNTAAVYLATLQAVSIAGIGLLYFALRRCVSRFAALAWIIVAIFPAFVLPGSLNDYLCTLYPGFERLAFLVLALLWTPPDRRSLSRGFILGLVLGSMQLIKFGTVAIAGAALLGADALVLGRALGTMRAWRIWVPALVATLAGFLLVEGAWAAWLLATLPRAWATDLLWPAYMIKNYQAYFAGDTEYWTWFDRGYFAAAQWPVCLGLLLSALIVLKSLAPRTVAWLWPEDRDSALDRCGPSLVLAISLPLAMALHFLPHRWVTMPWVWLPIAAGAAPAFALRPLFRAGVLLTLLPSFFICTKGRLTAVQQRHDTALLQPMQCPNGEFIQASPAEMQRFARVQELVAKMAADKFGAHAPLLVTVVEQASGWEHFFGFRQHDTRHAWITSGFVRPDEERQLVASLEKSAALILHGYGTPLLPDAASAAKLTSDPRTWGRFCNPNLTPETSAAFAARLGPPIILDDWCAVFPVR